MSETKHVPAEDGGAIDISGAMPVDTGILDICRSGTAEPTGWKVTFAGPSHPKTLAWADKASRRNLRRQAEIEAAQVNGRKYKAEDRTPEDVRRDNVEWVVGRIVDWTPVKIGQDVYAFSEAAAIELLLRPDMGWAFVQMVDYLAAETSFTRRSAKTS
jgi:hypothetical protein